MENLWTFQRDCPQTSGDFIHSLVVVVNVLFVVKTNNENNGNKNARQYLLLDKQTVGKRSLLNYFLPDASSTGNSCLEVEVVKLEV